MYRRQALKGLAGLALCPLCAGSAFASEGHWTYEGPINIDPADSPCAKGAVYLLGPVVGRYHGTPMAKHMPLPVDADHFDRWLELFEQTAREICPPQAEMHFVDRARRIATSLELGIANANGIMLGLGKRFRRQQEGAVP
jgi:hypothetical protein